MGQNTEFESLGRGKSFELNVVVGPKDLAHRLAQDLEKRKTCLAFEL